MACLKMPEVNHVLIAGNLTKDPVVRKTSNGIPVINFCLASNHRYRDADNRWAEDVCYVGVVAWSKLADSCMSHLRKGSAVLVDGELQSRTWHTDEDDTSRGGRTVVEIKAHRIQFLNKQEHTELAAPETSEYGVTGDDFTFTEAPVQEPASSAMLAYAAGFEESDVRGIFSEHASDSLELKLRPKEVS